MSETSGFPQYAGATSQMRTLAVRITDDLRAQLDVIAQLNDRSVTEEIRLSLENWIERSKSDPQVLKRAETVRAEIEREAQTKRNAIEAIFAKEPAKKATPRAATLPRTRLRVAERRTRPWSAGGFHSFATRALATTLTRHFVRGDESPAVRLESPPTKGT